MTTITRLLTYTSTAVSTGVQIIFVVGGALEVFKVSLFIFYVARGRHGIKTWEGPGRFHIFCPLVIEKICTTRVNYTPDNSLSL